jgi:hypothetical protein
LCWRVKEGSSLITDLERHTQLAVAWSRHGSLVPRLRRFLTKAYPISKIRNPKSIASPCTPAQASYESQPPTEHNGTNQSNGSIQSRQNKHSWSRRNRRLLGHGDACTLRSRRQRATQVAPKPIRFSSPAATSHSLMVPQLALYTAAGHKWFHACRGWKVRGQGHPRVRRRVVF